MLQNNKRVAVTLAIWIVCLAAAVLTVPGCATDKTKYPRNELVDQILKPRRGLPGKLTNRACEAWDAKSGECQLYVIKEYDLKNPSFRTTANDLGLTCNIAGKRYKFCRDKEGFCRFERKSCGFLNLKKCMVETGFIAADNEEFLLSSGALCFNEDRYPFDGDAG